MKTYVVTLHLNHLGETESDKRPKHMFVCLNTGKTSYCSYARPAQPGPIQL